ncbi:MAG TPA: 3-hydroxyacyl-CoA dehydrogenase [Actinomycetales bacterium]|nr:3-hydroxyacyl-CoA dehydrogenase [Actinomycetales bacterium]
MTDAASQSNSDAGTAASSTTVAVVGAGTMGAGIAEVAARAGHPALLLDAVAGAAAKAHEAMSARLGRDVSKGRLTDDAAAQIADRVKVAESVADLATATVVVEAIREDLAAKRDLFAALEDVVAPDALLATNTSSLSVTAVAAGLRHPGRVVGLHFFNPAQRMRLVEVVRGEDTDDDTLRRATELASAWGKTPVTCTSTPGFIVNRVARPFYGEAQRLVEERVADPGTIDLVLREAGGFPMGPFELTDLVGQDVNLAVSKSVWEQTFHDPRYAPTVFQQRLVDAGRLGRKTGRGVYDYVGDPTGTARAPRPGDPQHDATVTDEAAVAPSTVRYRGGWAVMAPLLERARAGGVEVVDESGNASSVTEAPDGSGVLLPSGGRLVETTGEPGVLVGADVVVLDWAREPQTTTRVAVAPAPNCSEATLTEAVGLLQAAGVSVSVIADGAGMVVARTVAMLVNEAADLVLRGEATAADVDTAMRLGTGYPEGPLAWGDRIGAAQVRRVLSGLHRTAPTGRYRISPALHRAAQNRAAQNRAAQIRAAQIRAAETGAQTHG